MRDKLDDDGNPVLDQNGEVERVFVKFDKPKVFSARVFNAEQMDGIPPLPPLDDRITEVSWNINERVEAMLEASGADIRHKAGDRAFYSPKDDYICLPERSQFHDDAAYYATALHELGHWTGHHSRLDRDLNHPFGSIGYAKEELRAEISSFMNAQRYGVSHDPGQHACYVASWVKVVEDDPREIIAASADAASICNYIGQYDRHQELTLEQTNNQSINLPKNAVEVGEALNNPQQLHDSIQSAPTQELQQLVLAMEDFVGQQQDLHRTLIAKDMLSQMDNIERIEKLPRNETVLVDYMQTNTVAKIIDGIDTLDDAKELDRMIQSARKASVGDPEEYKRQCELVGRALKDKTNVLEQRHALPSKDALATEVARPHTFGTNVIDGSSSEKLGKLQNALKELRDEYANDGRQQDVSNVDDVLQQVKAAINPSPRQVATKTQERTYLDVPYAEKNQAKALGARWDGKAKSWYAPEGTDLKPLQKWMPQTQEQAQSEVQAPQKSEPDIQIQTPQQEAYMPTAANEKTYLAVPFDEKDDAKALGARWDSKAKSWCAPEGTDLNPLQKWMPQTQQQSIQAPQQSDPIREFANALQQAGLIIDDIKADGELHRVPVEGRPRGKDGAYKLHLDGRPAGYIQNFVTGHKENWRGGEQQLSPEELAKQQAVLAAQRAKRDQEREKQYKENARKATEEHKNLPKATPDHPYLAKKGLNQDIIDKLDLRVDKLGNLVVPVKNKDDEIQSLQRIGGNGFKQFESGCKAQGGFNVIGESALKAQDKNEPIIISTGVATAASIHMATGEPVVVAFQDSNLKAVAEEFKSMYPYRSIFIAGDNDQHNVDKGLKNSGLESAKVAAKAVNGKYIIPKFSTSQRGREYSDFSDLHRIAGLQTVKRQVQAGLMMARANVAEDKERHQSQERSHDRVEEQKEVRKHKLEEKEAREKKRGRSI